MTDISVTNTVTQVEDRSWDLSPHGSEPGAVLNATLDVSKFAELYPNGYIPSGIVLGQITASKLYGPYDTAAVDGSEVAAGHLFGSLTVKAGATKIGGGLKVHGFVKESRLPQTTGKGALDAAAKTALKLVHYSA